jgi:hypothetical protein
LDSSLAGIHLDTDKAESTTTPTVFQDDPAKKSAHIATVEARADVKQVRNIATVAAAGWEPVALRTEQLNDTDIGPILQEVKTG